MSLEIAVEVTHAIFHRGYPYPLPAQCLGRCRARIVRATAPPVWRRQAVPVIKYNIGGVKTQGLTLNSLLRA